MRAVRRASPAAGDRRRSADAARIRDLEAALRQSQRDVAFFVDTLGGLEEDLDETLEELRQARRLLETFVGYYLARPRPTLRELLESTTGKLLEYDEHGIYLEIDK